uniref:CID domain-containing protein n=1 Tax=Peromyscus maniculatus bairdii TaxID=230844 RepID=A0A8C8W6V4_PERMB
MSEHLLAKAGAAGTLEDICHDYQSSLEDLTFNSKPHINMLTIVAEENLPFAKEIVSVIEAQTAKAPSSEKLPLIPQILPVFPYILPHNSHSSPFPTLSSQPSPSFIHIYLFYFPFLRISIYSLRPLLWTYQL